MSEKEESRSLTDAWANKSQARLIYAVQGERKLRVTQRGEKAFMDNCYIISFIFNTNLDVNLDMFCK